jgi:putative photosynthetic complex assembly protein 2
MLSAVLCAVLAWYLGTGLVAFANRRAAGRGGSILLGSLLLVGAGAAGIEASLSVATPAGAYVAFLSALLVWGWLEMSYLMGVITGPEKRPCPPDLGGWRRFLRGVNVSLYHELMVIGVGVVVIVACWDAANPVAGWTFATLWLARWSAKLNLFLGVANMDMTLLPDHMRYLGTYMATRRMNPLLPISVAVGAVFAGVHLLAAAEAVPGGFDRTAWTLLATVTGLAVAEHALMVLPFKDSRLWRWAVQ